MSLLHEELTNKIISGFYTVYNFLGYGFLERVYENALFLELTDRGCFCEKQKMIEVHYKGSVVGAYFADTIVDQCVIIEIEAAEGIAKEHEHQLLNYLKATNMEIGLLLNFGKKPEFKRKIFTNDKKHLAQ